MFTTLRNDPWLQGAAVLIVLSVFLTFLCILVGAWKLAPIPFLFGVAVTAMVFRRPTPKSQEDT